jgi:murein DD-endopeptidase MepM/ murein hydrolase activator NlpD
MRRRLSGEWTILILRSGGQSPLRLSIPNWFLSLVHSCALTLLGATGFFGWHLHGFYGINGHSMAHLAVVAEPERWSLFELTAPTPLRGRVTKEAVQLGLGSRRAASLLLTGVVAPEWSAAAASGGDLGDGTLRWPVEKGLFGRGWGSGEHGYHRAVDIGGKLGSPVSAAAPGIVGYVGSELRGYGNVVMVVHPGGWVTLYAHNSHMLVKAGEHVHQGQQIATVGSTGRSTGPHVHFELIYRGRNCDPLPFVSQDEIGNGNLRGRSAKQLTWDLMQPPKARAVRCKPRMMHPMHHDDVESLMGAADLHHIPNG